MVKKEYDTLAVRLTQILNKLNNGLSIEVKELAEEFNVSTRTIQKDLNERFSYLPLVKKNNRYFLEEHYLGKLSFKDIENFAIISGIRGLYPSLNEDYLKKILDSSIQQIYMIQGHNYEKIHNKQDVFQTLEFAILNHNSLAFLYKDTNRLVEPYKITNIKGIWYLVAVEQEKLKTFSLTKIKNLKQTERKFTPQQKYIQEIENKNNQWFSNQTINILLEIDHKVAYYFQRREIFPNQQIIKTLQNGNIHLTTQVSFEEEILKLVRYWIPHITIISPQQLQDKLQNSLKEYLSKF